MHVDLPLIDAWQARAGRRGRPGDPVLDPAQVEPGTWWLALVDGYLAAVSLDLDAVRYLGRRPLAVSALSLHPWRGGAGDARVDLDPASGALDTYVEVRAGDAAVLRLGVRLQAEPDGVQRAAPWTAVEAR
jgi:hypothetical protein